jgi:uncharacterized protein
MKPSRYNIFFDQEGKKIGFNSFTGQFIVLDHMLYEMFALSEKMKDFEELKSVHPKFFNFLGIKGFVVEDEVDELELVKQMAYKKDNDESLFEIHINPTMNCNFKCWYCYETHIKDSKMDEQTIAHVLRFVEQVLQTKNELKKLSMSWFGGEPLLYYKKVVLPILKSSYPLAKSRGVEFVSSMTTNGLLIDQEMVDSAKLYGFNFFQITLDGNRERHDKVRFISEERGSYDKIVSNIMLAARSQLEVVVRINCSKETLEGIDDIAEDFSVLEPEARKWMRFDLHKVWQISEDLDDTIEQKRRNFRSRGYKVVGGLHDTVENSCYGDHRNHATINYNGEVFKCTARDFTTANSEGVLKEDGTIHWNDKYEKRMNIKFKNKPCLECKILPICGGGCSQQALEHEGIDYCVHDFDENKKLQLVINKFMESLSEP